MMNSTERITILAGMRPGYRETRTFMTMPGMRFVSLLWHGLGYLGPHIMRKAQSKQKET